MSKFHLSICLAFSLGLAGISIADEGTGGGSSGGGNRQASTRHTLSMPSEGVLRCLTEAEFGVADGVLEGVLDPTPVFEACGASPALIECTTQYLREGFSAGRAHEACFD
jgi:hypothetical protein